MSHRCAVIVVLACACTRDNPAFGDGTEGGTGESSATMVPTSDPSDPSDPSMTGSVDSDATSATSSSMDASDDAQDPTTTTDPTAASDPTDPIPDLGTEACAVPKPAIFEVVVFDENSKPVEMPCGVATQLTGPVMAGPATNQLTMQVCINDTCDCGEGEGDIVTIEFIDLEPTPVDAIVGMDEACIAVTVARGPDNDCRAAWMVAETWMVAAEHPLFMATNFPAPEWGLVVPDATLGRDLEQCAEGVCALEEPGFYSMMLGDLGPLEPDEPAVGMFDPYANGVGVSYDVHPLFAQVGEDCEPAIGWAAIQTE